MNDNQREAGNKALNACIVMGFYKILAEWNQLSGNTKSADLLFKQVFLQGLEIFKLTPEMATEDLDTINGTMDQVDQIVAALKNKKKGGDPSLN